jgi:hypothetical protein
MTGPNPTNQGRPDAKRHIPTDANGIPLALRLTGANVHDDTMLEQVVDARALPEQPDRAGVRHPIAERQPEEAA